jgi:hypothetical protein
MIHKAQYGGIMKNHFYKGLVILLAVFSLCIYGSICFAEQKSNTDVDNAIKMYENGDYDMADKLIVTALKKDKRDVAALTWYALIKMEIAKNKKELNPDACKLVVNKQIIYLNTYYGSDLMFLDEDKLYSYYHAAYAKAYWLTDNNREVNWFVDKSLALYPRNYEALHVKGQVALGMAEKTTPSITQNFGDPSPVNIYLNTAYKSFLAEMEAAGNDAPEIKSRAAYWAASTSYRLNKMETDKIKELLETSIRSNPNGIYGALSKKMFEKLFNVK